MPVSDWWAARARRRAGGSGSHRDAPAPAAPGEAAAREPDPEASPLEEEPRTPPSPVGRQAVSPWATEPELAPQAAQQAAPQASDSAAPPATSADEAPTESLRVASEPFRLAARSPKKTCPGPRLGLPRPPPSPAGGHSEIDPSFMERATLGSWRHSVAEFHGMVRRGEAERRGRLPSHSTDGDESEDGSDDGVLAAWLPFGAQLQGMQKWSPEFYHWIASRMGTRTKAFLIVSFASLEAGKFLLAGKAYQDGVNTFSILVAKNFFSLLFALALSFMLEGGVVINKILSWRALGRFMGIAVLFTFASGLVLVAYRIGTPSVEVVTIGYSYMPLSAVLSYFVFRRGYGNLEWLSIGMMTLAILAFVLLREESKATAIGEQKFKLYGFGLVFAAVAISVLASILAERIFKEKSAGLMRQQGRKQDKFYIMKVHLDFSSLVVSICLWSARTSAPATPLNDFFEEWSRSRQWFGAWGRYQVLMVLVSVCQGWAAGLVTQSFSTVIKAIVQTLSVVVVMLAADGLMGNRYHFHAREVPSVVLAIIIGMSAVIFQTGRINFKVLRKAANLGPEAFPFYEMQALPAPENDEMTPSKAVSPSKIRLRASAKGSREEEKSLLEASSSSGEAPTKSWMKVLTTYALILVYIVSDAGRTIVLQKSLQKSVINSTSMGLVCYICGVMVASSFSIYSDGLEGLKSAWAPRKIVTCLPAAFLFALATTLANMSFAQGISSALFVVLGKFYTPVAALGARFVMGKYYMWLEWMALLILTLASVAFGYLKAFDVAVGQSSGAPPTAMALVLGSATVSALASLVTEKILKGEKAPFHQQKVRLDAGCILSSLLLLPTLGFLASRAQDVPWAERPYDYASCGWDSPCWDSPRRFPWSSPAGHTCANVGCGCECSEGVFAGWGGWSVLLAVAVNTLQGWLVGKVTQRFSVVHRAIADSFSLLAIYFIGDPFLNGTKLDNFGLNLVAFIVPLSTATFSVATSEMEKVFNARSRLEASSPAKSVTAHGGRWNSPAARTQLPNGFSPPPRSGTGNASPPIKRSPRPVLLADRGNGNPASPSTGSL